MLLVAFCNPAGSVGSSHGITLFFMQIDTLHVLSLSLVNAVMLVFFFKFWSNFSTLSSENIKISVEELSEIKRISTGQLRLLGFKPLSCLKDYHNLRPSTFIFPSDEVAFVLILLWYWNICFFSCLCCLFLFSLLVDYLLSNAYHNSISCLFDDVACEVLRSWFNR